MVIDDLVKRRDSWLLAAEDPAGIVISSRVRLARNLRGCSFPGWAPEDERVRVWQRVRDALGDAMSAEHPVFLEMPELGDVDKEVLKERHLISREIAVQGAGSGVAVSPDEGIAVMINEEDHLRLQGIAPGLNLAAVWDRIDRLDSRLEAKLEYAFSRRLGYLTACPTNVGTGLRASVMMHLSGLRLMDEIEPVMKGLDKLGVAVRGLLGEGTEAYGNICQISNHSTLGESEAAILKGLTEVAREVAGHERNARLRLMQNRQSRARDEIGRAYGVLRHAHVLRSREAIDLLAGLRLGVEFEVVRGLTVGDVNEIMLLSQPGHLQKILGRPLEPDARDEARAAMIREKLSRVTLA
ncbi:MAG: protein arginine kinase [Lentisphaerae bacterium]|nr:protein arginine kinase [Lentisphaerota bacterium]